MNRRGFLSAVSAFIASTAITPVMGAAVMGAEPDQYAHIRGTIERYTRIVDYTPIYLYRVDPHMNELFDDLMGYMMDHFTPTGSDAERQAITALFRDPISSDDITKIPPVILETIIPVAIMRELIGTHKAQFDVDKVPSWDRFVEVYQKLILYA